MAEILQNAPQPAKKRRQLWIIAIAALSGIVLIALVGSLSTRQPPPQNARINVRPTEADISAQPADLDLLKANARITVTMRETDISTQPAEAELIKATILSFNRDLQAQTRPSAEGKMDSPQR